MSYRIGLKGSAESKSKFGFVVGREIDVSWEVTNLDSKIFPGGRLSIQMSAPNGQFVFFNYPIPQLKPNDKITLGTKDHPLTTNVLAQGFILFSANMGKGVIIESPPGRVRSPKESFFSIFGKPMEEVYEMWALFFAVIGLIGTVIVGVLQLLLDFGILHPF